MFHLVGALSEHGKLDWCASEVHRKEAKEFYDKAISVLDDECC
jgi:hypothetical protein